MPDDYGNPEGVLPIRIMNLAEREGAEPDDTTVPFWGAVNVSDATLHGNLVANIKRPLPQVQPHLDVSPQVLALVGGGPSLADTLPELDALVAEGVKVISMNGTHDWLLERGIRPSAHVQLDARAFNARFVQSAVPTCRYYIASQCHPSVLEALERQGADVWLWHTPNSDEDVEVLDKHYHTEVRLLEEHGVVGGPVTRSITRHWWPVGGGTSVGTRSIRLMRTLGFRQFHLFGIDGAYLGNEHHAYEQPENDTRRVCKVWLSGRSFNCATWMVKQYEDWLNLLKDSAKDESVYEVHGGGLMAWSLEVAASGAEDLSLEDDVTEGEVIDGNEVRDEGHA